MLYYDRIDVSEGIHINETNHSHEFIVCCYNYFLIKTLLFNHAQGWNGLIQRATEINEVSIVNVDKTIKGFNFEIWEKVDAINLSKNSDLNRKNGLL